LKERAKETCGSLCAGKGCSVRCASRGCGRSFAQWSRALASPPALSTLWHLAMPGPLRIAVLWFPPAPPSIIGAGLRICQFRAVRGGVRTRIGFRPTLRTERTTPCLTRRNAAQLPSSRDRHPILRDATIQKCAQHRERAVAEAALLLSQARSMRYLLLPPNDYGGRGTSAEVISRIRRRMYAIGDSATLVSPEPRSRICDAVGRFRATRGAPGPSHRLRRREPFPGSLTGN
jgi:hypothetical protein